MKVNFERILDNKVIQIDLMETKIQHFEYNKGVFDEFYDVEVSKLSKNNFMITMEIKSKYIYGNEETYSFCCYRYDVRENKFHVMYR